MEGSRLRWIAAVVVALAVGFLVGTWRTGATIQTGQVYAKGAGGGSIVTSGWTYGFGSDVAWTDDMGLWHNGGKRDVCPRHCHPGTESASPQSRCPGMAIRGDRLSGSIVGAPSRPRPRQGVHHVPAAPRLVHLITSRGSASCETRGGRASSRLCEGGAWGLACVRARGVLCSAANRIDRSALGQWRCGPTS